jgi:hypothetical protein
MQSTFAPTFYVYRDKISKMDAYVDVMSPVITANGGQLPIFVESIVVLTVAYMEDFLASLVGSAAREREVELRKHLSNGLTEQKRTTVITCDIPALVQLAKRRVDFRKRGARLESLFQVVFGCSPWPNVGTFTIINDLVLVRQVIVHHGGGDLGSYANQVHQSGLFTVRDYQGLKVYRLAHLQVLMLYREALSALNAQLQYLERVLPHK